MTRRQCVADIYNSVHNSRSPIVPLPASHRLLHKVKNNLESRVLTLGEYIDGFIEYTGAWLMLGVL